MLAVMPWNIGFKYIEFDLKLVKEPAELVETDKKIDQRPHILVLSFLYSLCFSDLSLLRLSHSLFLSIIHYCGEFAFPGCSLLVE